MASSSSNLVSILLQAFRIIKCKYEHEDKICRTCRIEYKNRGCFFEYAYFKDDLIECKCLCCNKNY